MMELTLAIALFVLCLMPLIGMPMRLLNGQKKALTQMQESMRAQEAMFYILTQFKQNHPTYNFSSSRGDPIRIDDVIKTKPFDKAHYYIHHNSKTNEQKATCNLLTCHVCFDALSQKKKKNTLIYVDGVNSKNMFRIAISWERKK